MSPDGTGTPLNFKAGNKPNALPLSAAGSPDDPVMREALRLIEAFLAIEDPSARTALITLAEGLVSYDWVRKAQGRRR